MKNIQEKIKALEEALEILCSLQLSGSTKMYAGERVFLTPLTLSKSIQDLQSITNHLKEMKDV